MADPARTIRLYDTSIIIAASTNRPAKIRGYTMGWNDNDWETYNRIKLVLTAAGFTIETDGKVARHYPSLAKSHHRGWRDTPAGRLWVKSEVFPVGCKFEFFQELVTVNGNGGEYDFDRRAKMPYLIGKAFEAAYARVRAHVLGRGFIELVDVDSANPDPLAYFNARWDGQYERVRGIHRFRRDASGWPDTSEIDKACWGVSAERPLIQHGDVRYFRDRGGRLARGRCYGGINGMWLVVYGPGKRDFTHLPVHELFDCRPSEQPRRLKKGGHKRLADELAKAVNAQAFERAIVLRDVLTRIAA